MPVTLLELPEDVLAQRVFVHLGVRSLAAVHLGLHGRGLAIGFGEPVAQQRLEVGR